MDLYRAVGGMPHPIYLVREADAGGRLSWPGPDKLRPLSAEGWRQAQELAERLDGAPVARVISSPWLRCRQTVLRLADARDLQVEPEPALGEIASIDRALELVWASRGAPTVICSHPGLLQALMECLRGSARVVPLCGLAWTATARAPASATAGGDPVIRF
jgi:phosphohistidine phosphatase SixA